MELLTDRMYLRYWLAVVVSFLGDAITLTAVLFLVGSNTNSVFMISLVFMAHLLPTVLLGPVIGPLIDRYQRRFIMVYADLYRMILAVLMIFFQSNNIMLLILLFLVGIGKAFFEPARIASIPQIVGVHRIPQGIALFQSTSAILKFLGPVIAGFLIAFQGTTIIFIYDAISYFISALLLFTLKFLDVKKVTVKLEAGFHFFQALTTGYRKMVDVPIVRALSLLLMPVMFSLGMFLTNYKGFMFQVLDVTPIEFGWLEAFLAGGIVCGAMVGPKLLSRYPHETLIQVSLITVGICCFMIYAVPSGYQWGGMGVVVLWSMLIGMGESMLQVPTANLLLLKIPDEVRGQGVSLTNSLMNGFYLLGSLVSGLLAAYIGIIHTISLSGVILIGSCVFYQLTLKKKIGKGQPADRAV